MEQKRRRKVQEAVMEFEEGDKFCTVLAGREGRDRELMCNGRNKVDGLSLLVLPFQLESSLPIFAGTA